MNKNDIILYNLEWIPTNLRIDEIVPTPWDEMYWCEIMDWEHKWKYFVLSQLELANNPESI